MRNDILKLDHPIIGMIHLQPLPGSGKSVMPVSDIVKRALQDGATLVEGGVDALMIENAGDQPFCIEESVDPITIAMMSRIASQLHLAYPIPLGVSCVINSIQAALAIACSAEADFIRCTGWAEGYYSPVGYVEPRASIGYRYRSWIGAQNIRVLADVEVKNGSHFLFSDRSLEMKCYDQEANLADGIVITGTASGKEPVLEEVKRLHEVAHLPLLIGSGVDPQTIKELYPYAQGFIVGSCFKENKDLMNPPILAKVKELVSTVKALRANV